MRDDGTVGEATVSLLTAAVRAPGQDVVRVTFGGSVARAGRPRVARWGLAGEEGFEPSIP
jgi:hypothetical protein